MRRFVLWRERDISGMTGTGRVAEGVVLSDGRALLAWLSPPFSLGLYGSINDLIAVHGHAGATRVIWLDRLGIISPRREVAA